MECTYFHETESGGAFDSPTADRRNNCTASGSSIKRKSPSSTSSLQEPPSSTSSLQEPNSKKICLSPFSSLSQLAADQSLDGFAKIALPITSPTIWASPDSNPLLQSTPTLRRCDPINSPGTNKNRDSSTVSDTVINPLSPESSNIFASASTPSPAKASSSASATMPPVPSILRRSFSGLSPKAYQAAITPPDSVNRVSPNSKRMKRMEDRMREMSKWWEEFMHEGEEEDGRSEDDKNGAPKDDEPETDSEEAVSVERSGKVLIIHIKCPCNKDYQILLSEKNCYYKLAKLA